MHLFTPFQFTLLASDSKSSVIDHEQRENKTSKLVPRLNAKQQSLMQSLVVVVSKFKRKQIKYLDLEKLVKLCADI